MNTAKNLSEGKRRTDGKSQMRAFLDEKNKADQKKTIQAETNFHRSTSYQDDSESEDYPHASLTDFTPKKNFAKENPNLVTDSEFEWLFKNRKGNGFEAAFKQVGRKFFVHNPTFYKCLLNR